MTGRDTGTNGKPRYGKSMAREKLKYSYYIFVFNNISQHYNINTFSLLLTYFRKLNSRFLKNADHISTEGKTMQNSNIINFVHFFLSIIISCESLFSEINVINSDLRM